MVDHNSSGYQCPYKAHVCYSLIFCCPIAARFNVSVIPDAVP